LNFQFTPAAGVTLQTENLSADVETAFDTWYQSATSHTFGSQFTLSMRFQASADLAIIRSIAVTAVNAKGTSGARVVELK
jgi:hypothetical protein